MEFSVGLVETLLLLVFVLFDYIVYYCKNKHVSLLNNRICLMWHNANLHCSSM